MNVTLDVSLTAGWILEDEKNSISLKFLEQILEGKLTLIQPDLWWIETTNLLKTSVLRKRMTLSEATKANEILNEIPMKVISFSEISSEKILNFSLDWSLTAYDAFYALTAIYQHSKLGTLDRDLLKLKGKNSDLQWLRLL